MSGSTGHTRRRSSTRSTPGVVVCPSCGGALKPDANWCPACDFTGASTMDLFPDPPPPLLPILDAVGLLDDAAQRKIESARDALTLKFPQFRWHICIVNSGPETSLPLFGFWLLNACPLGQDETSSDRAWTVLLVIDSGSGSASLIPGYAAEPYLSTDHWKSILTTMGDIWASGKHADAIVRFFTETRRELARAWKRFGSRRSKR